MWDLSCPDWEQRLRDGRSLVPELPLDKIAADRAVGVFNALQLPDVIGTPTLGEAAGDWFRDIVRALFGSLIDGERMIREIFLLVSKKNSKTTNGGGLMMTAALLSPRPRAEYLFAGATQALADIGFQQALGMVLADKYLERRVHIQEHLKRITVRDTGVKLLIKTFDETILTGFKPSGGALIDEVHLLGEMPKAPAVIRQIRGGMLPFAESFLVFITTQSEKPPAGVFREELQQARAVRDGKLKGRLLPVLYEFPERMLRNDEWREPRYWHMVNPNVGRSLTIEGLVEQYDKAVASGDSALRGWASQHLNVEIGIALRSDRWAGTEYWERCADATLVDLDELIDRCDVVTAGIDGGGLDDLLGLAFTGRDRDTRAKLVWTKAWAHRDVLERRKEIAPALLDFVNEGTLSLFDDPGDEVAELVDLIVKVDEAGLLPAKSAIGVDIVGITEIVDELERRGITVESERIVAITQGWKLSNTIKTLERWLAAGTVRHGGTLLMNWVMGNAKIEPRGNAVMITKQTSGTGKIDPLMALLASCALMARNPEATPQSVYALDEEPPAPEMPGPVLSDYEKAKAAYAKKFLVED